MDTKQKLALLESFYRQAVEAGMAAKYHCDGVLVLSCFQEDAEKEEQPDLEIPLQNREEGRPVRDRASKGSQPGAGEEGERRES